MTAAEVSPRSARWAMGLWFLLAIVVFNVTFDWEVRAADHAFVAVADRRQQQGLPTLTINDGFRPMVRDAARHAARVAGADRRRRHRGHPAARRGRVRKGTRAVPTERPQVR